jgi:hypothetical protein
MQTSEFNRLMKYAHMNDDPYGVLGSIYDNDLPHPYFDPKHIGFSKLRDFDHNKWLSREQTNRTIVFEDLEYIIPGVKLHWDAVGDPPCTEQDKLITSSITINDHLWPCEYAFNSWHLVQTHLQNIETYVEQPTTRPYFADILLGNLKPQRKIFFELLQTTDQLDKNLINAFGEYKTPYIDASTDEIDLFFKNMKLKEYTDTTLFFKGNFASQYISKHIQESTWYSIVAETLDDNRLFFPTEKTGKALMSGKPFIVLGSKHFLKNLRSIGFKTFHPIIDESYDLIDSVELRTRAAYCSFIELQKQDPITVRQKLQDVLDHNEKCMRDKAFLSQRARNLLQNLQTPV